MSDNVNHPSHYETGAFECIDVMLETQGKEAVMNFCLCNAFKYIYRHNNKNGMEDIRKAKWYIDKYLELADTPKIHTTNHSMALIPTVPPRCNICKYSANSSYDEPCDSCEDYSNYEEGSIINEKE